MTRIPEPIPELIVFDWDGTLVDSMEPIAGAVQEAARQAGLPVPEASAARSVIGLGLEEVGYHLFPDAGPKAFGTWVERYRALYWSEPERFARTFPGVPAMLAELASRHVLALATGKGRRGLDLALERSGLSTHFAATRCGEETRSKPHPRMLEELMDELGMGSEGTLLVGDTSFDMEMAVAAGVTAVGVSGGSHGSGALMEAGAVTVLGSVTDLPGWLGGRGTGDGGRTS